MLHRNGLDRSRSPSGHSRDQTANTEQRDNGGSDPKADAGNDFPSPSPPSIPATLPGSTTVNLVAAYQER